MKTLLTRDQFKNIFSDLRIRSQRIIGAVDTIEEALFFPDDFIEKQRDDQQPNIDTGAHNGKDGITTDTIDCPEIEGISQSEDQGRCLQLTDHADETIEPSADVPDSYPQDYRLISATLKKPVKRRKQKECSRIQYEEDLGESSDLYQQTPDIALIQDLLAEGEKTTKQLRDMSYNKGYRFSAAAFSNMLNYYRKKGLIGRRNDSKRNSNWYLIKND